MTSITTLFTNSSDAELLFIDTDSLTYEIKSENVYEEFFKHKFYESQNEMVFGKMKDEYKGIRINKFVGLKSKTDCMLSDDCKESNTAKEVNIAMQLKEYEYSLLLLNKKIIRHIIKRIKSKKHKIGTYEIIKISLSCFDDKKFVLDDSIHMLSYFHKDLKNRFSQMIINKKRFSKIIIKKKRLLKMVMDKKRFSQTKISAHT